MDKYYIKLLTRLNNGYYLNNSEIRDLEQYLEIQLEQLKHLKECVKWYII